MGGFGNARGGGGGGGLYGGGGGAPDGCAPHGPCWGAGGGGGGSNLIPKDGTAALDENGAEPQITISYSYPRPHRHIDEWTIFPSADVGGEGSLHGISCLNAKHCMAVGGRGTDEALVESWNGGEWSSVPTPVPPPLGDEGEPEDVSLNGVSCVSARFCVAVGGLSLRTHGPHCCNPDLIETWNGREWSVVPNPGSSKNAHASFADVSCVSSRFCVAVGISQGGLGDAPGFTLVGSWNGTEWSIFPTPNPGIFDELEGVSCVSVKACVAVGRFREEDATFSRHSLVESWNGTAWSVVPSPNGENSLSGVLCVSAKRCVAVGGSASGTLVESWNGTAWSVLESANPEGSGIPRLDGVSCVSARSCAAVGSDSTEEGASQTLVETSKADKWSIAPSANGTSGVSLLNGVSCVSNESCFAVGGAKAAAEGPLQTLMENGRI